MNITNVFQSGDVVRFHTTVGVDKQKLSEHQWGVALIVQYIYPSCPKQLLLAALTHDAAESFTGDVPFPVKKQNGQLNDLLRRIEEDWEVENGIYFNLTRLDHDILKIADTLDGMWYCVNQVKKGNILAKEPFYKWYEFFLNNFGEYRSSHPNSWVLFNQLVTEMERI